MPAPSVDGVLDETRGEIVAGHEDVDLVEDRDCEPRPSRSGNRGIISSDAVGCSADGQRHRQRRVVDRTRWGTGGQARNQIGVEVSKIPVKRKGFVGA